MLFLQLREVYSIIGNGNNHCLRQEYFRADQLLFGVGATITVVPMLVAVVVGRLVFKISLLDLLGTITGGMTSPRNATYRTGPGDSTSPLLSSG